MSLTLVQPKRKPLYCSFCGKEKDDVAYLVSGPTVFICNKCVELCREIGTKTLVENVIKDREDKLEEALRDCVDWIVECGSDYEGRQLVLTEARRVLAGFETIS